MREKDLRKAIAYHMKKSQSQYDPKQKGLPVDQARINYLEELSDLKSFGGKSFSATMMVGSSPLAVRLDLVWHFKYSLFFLNKPSNNFLCSLSLQLQDRESMVTLLVGARYGVSQVVNHKLSILSTLTEFSSITRIELLPESDKVSLVKIYLQDIKVRAAVCTNPHMQVGNTPSFITGHFYIEETSTGDVRWSVSVV